MVDHPGLAASMGVFFFLGLVAAGSQIPVSSHIVSGTVVSVTRAESVTGSYCRVYVETEEYGTLDMYPPREMNVGVNDKVRVRRSRTIIGTYRHDFAEGQNQEKVGGSYDS